MADSIAHGVASHNSDGWRLVKGTSWEGPRGAGAARSHASSVRPLGRVSAPLPEVGGASVIGRSDGRIFQRTYAREENSARTH
jgi:hypothetical protein